MGNMSSSSELSSLGGEDMGFVDGVVFTNIVSWKVLEECPKTS